MYSKYIMLVLYVLNNCCKFGESIKCYDCNSANNSMCIDPTLYDQETLSRFLTVTDCGREVSSAVQKVFFCRKIVQTILRKNHDSQLRVTRSCGWVPHPTRDCYKADNEDHLETVCQCFSDQCNAVTTVTAVAPVTALTVVAAAVFTRTLL